MSLPPFTFPDAGSVNLGVTVASGNVSLGTATGGLQVRLSSPAGTSDCYIRFGSSTVAAAVATGIHFPAGTVEVVTIPAGTTHVAAITGSATTTLYAARSAGS